jgi:hypothetical protein
VNPRFRTVITLTIDSHWPDREEALRGADELVEEFRSRLAADETLVKTAVMVRRRRVNGELHD